MSNVAASDPFETWIDAYGQEIHAYLWRMLGDRRDAEDCLQETFLRAWRSGRRAEVREPRAWLYTIAANTARTQLRRRRRNEVERRDPQEDLAAPDDRVSRDRLEAVRHAVGALPDRQRQALLLRRYQGLSYAEVARVLGGSAEAARANVYQAVRKLRAAFPEDER
jgi:RNA polymerase sigma-70 factor (ECF subfamily)